MFARETKNQIKQNKIKSTVYLSVYRKRHTNYRIQRLCNCVRVSEWFLIAKQYKKGASQNMCDCDVYNKQNKQNKQKL